MPPLVLDALRLIRLAAKPPFPDDDLVAPMEWLEKYGSDAMAFMPKIGLQQLLFYYQEMKDLEDVPGDIVEFGVYRGDTLVRLLQLSELFDVHRSSRQIVGFDTFGGFPESAQMSGSSSREERRLADKLRDTSIDLVRRKISGKATERVTLVQGDILETLPRHLAEWRNRIAMALIDVDIQNATTVILEQIWDRMSPGGRIYLDDYNKSGYTETDGVDEFIASRGLGITIHRVGFGHPSAYIKVPSNAD